MTADEKEREQRVQKVRAELVRYEHPLFVFDARPNGDGVELEIRYRADDAGVHIYLLQLHPMNWKRVEEFIRENAPASERLRHLGVNCHATRRHVASKRDRRKPSPLRRYFDSSVIDRLMELRQLCPRKIQYLQRQRPCACTALHHTEAARPAKNYPHLVELPRDQPPENGRHIHTRVVIGAPLLSWLVVIAKFRMIEARIHVICECDRPAIMNALDEEFVKRRAASSQVGQSWR